VTVNGGKPASRWADSGQEADFERSRLLPSLDPTKSPEVLLWIASPRVRDSTVKGATAVPHVQSAILALAKHWRTACSARTGGRTLPMALIRLREDLLEKAEAVRKLRVARTAGKKLWICACPSILSDAV